LEKDLTVEASSTRGKTDPTSQTISFSVTSHDVSLLLFTELLLEGIGLIGLLNCQPQQQKIATDLPSQSDQGEVRNCCTSRKSSKGQDLKAASRSAPSLGWRRFNANSCRATKIARDAFACHCYRTLRVDSSFAGILF